ncbi:MAG: hypothetical protein RMK29_05985 [Myxococcales bacterium]|nr:hypothetical protein [Myxococcota bacterium]MDW8281240.1 hypothetical protein [Myxococcales bacterium]
MRRVFVLGPALWALGWLGGCARSLQVPATLPEPMSEKVLAARKLQQPLSQHLCQAAVYPTADARWPLSRVATISGRGPTFLEALEALCREADGLKAQAVVDLSYRRLPNGWSPSHELRGTAVRFQGHAPPPPRFAEIHPPPPPPRSGHEPPPGGLP